MHSARRRSALSRVASRSAPIAAATIRRHLHLPDYPRLRRSVLPFSLHGGVRVHTPLAAGARSAGRALPTASLPPASSSACAQPRARRAHGGRRGWPRPAARVAKRRGWPVTPRPPPLHPRRARGPSASGAAEPEVRAVEQGSSSSRPPAAAGLARAAELHSAPPPASTCARPSERRPRAGPASAPPSQHRSRGVLRAAGRSGGGGGRHGQRGGG